MLSLEMPILVELNGIYGTCFICTKYSSRSSKSGTCEELGTTAEPSLRY